MANRAGGNLYRRRLFVLLTVLRLRQWVVEAVPVSLRYSFAVGIGLFLTFIGLNQTGIVALGVPGAPVRAGHLTTAPVLVAIARFLVLSVLAFRKVRGAILLGIVTTALIAFAARIVPPPDYFVSFPPGLGPILWQLDFRGVMQWSAFPIVLASKVVDEFLARSLDLVLGPSCIASRPKSRISSTIRSSIASASLRFPSASATARAIDTNRSRRPGCASRIAKNAPSLSFAAAICQAPIDFQIASLRRITLNRTPVKPVGTEIAGVPVTLKGMRHWRS